MSDHFKTEKAAEDFCSGLQRRFIRALVLDPSDHCDNWQVISPDLDFRREERVWESAAEALAERIGAEVLAALTQPQTEGRPGYPLDEDGDGKGVPMFADEGAATAADADLAEQVDDEWRGKVIDLADELDAEGKKDVAERVFALTLAFANTEPGPYAKAFRERVCPVPEFPGLESGYPDHVAPIPQTEGECPDCKGDRAGYKASCPTCSGTGKEKA